MNRLVLSIFLFLAVVPVQGQEYLPTAFEDSLYRMFREFLVLRSSEERQSLNKRILDYMKSELQKPESFSYRYDSLRKQAGVLSSEDGLFRIFTWNLPLNEWEHEYYGVLQVYDRDTDSCRVHLLENRLSDIQEIKHVSTSNNMWPGALYYDMRREKQGKNITYALMGYNFKDRWSDMKIIEVLYFDRDKNPIFGKPVFNTPEGIQHRVIFEYSGEVAMNLRYNPDMKMIVYDHLAPIEPELSAHPRFYAPDFSYDGYRFKRGMWMHQENIDVRNR